METLRLPRQIRDEPGMERLATELVARSQPLWPGGDGRAARVEIGTGLVVALKSAFSAGRIIRGLEGAERILAREQRGLDQVDRRTGAERGGRVSRLLLLADDGSERFYRSVDFLLRRHEPRVLALRSELSESALGELLFGPDQVARLLMLQHKDAVAAVLLALAGQWGGEPSRP